MGDQQHGALEIGERFYQRLARIDVEVVGRLVQNQQLRRVARRKRQQQPRLFATGQVAGWRLRAIGVQPETRELRAHLARVGARQCARHVVDRRFLLDQFVRLVLGEIADAQLWAAPHLAG